MKMPEVSKEINSKFSMNMKLTQMIHSDILITVIDKKRMTNTLYVTTFDYKFLSARLNLTTSDYEWLRVTTSYYK